MAVQEGTSAPEEVVREVVGTFTSHEALEDAMSELESSGFDRAALSLLAADSMVAPGLTRAPVSTPAAADDDSAPRAAAVSDTDVRQGRTLATSMAGVIAAFAATGATIISGGGVLAAIIGAAAIGGGAAAAVSAIGQRVAGSREDFLGQQIDSGGIILWVRLLKPGQDSIAMDVLRRRGASDVHIHEGGA
ncbi:MAG: hypothetical protein AB7P02_27055 [Alphaproteobacteria bacterium]